MMINEIERFLFSTLRGRLIVSVALVHAVMMALFVADLTLRQRAMLLDRQEEEARALSQALAISAAGWISADDVAGLQELADAQRLYPELLFAIVTDVQGRVLAHSDHLQRGLYMLDLPRDARQTVLAKTPALVDVATPAQLGTHQVGWIRIGLGQKANAAKLAQITRSGVLYALTAIAVGSFIAWVMGDRITRRIRLVLETINKVRAGDRQARAPVIGTDEPAIMANEFNSMLEAVHERENDLRRLHLFHQSIVNNAAYGIIATTPEGIVTSFNLAAERLLGYKAGELIGKQTPVLWHDRGELERRARQLFGEFGETVAPDFEVFTARARRNLPDEDEWTFIRKDGTRVSVILSVTAQRDDRGQITGYLGLAYDITERRQVQEKLKKLNEELEERVRQRTADLKVKTDEIEESQRALLNLVEDMNEKASALENANNALAVVNKELESFSYSVSHDLRAPLRSIDGFSRVLLEDYAERLDADAKDSLQRIRAASQRMGNLIDDLLKLAQVSRGEMLRGRVDLSALARTVADELRQALPKQQLEFAIAPDLVANGDARLLRVVLENLLGNACKFSSKRPVSRIEFGATERDGGRTFYVRDNGAGFDPTYAGKMFEAFRRFHADTEFHGTGIGLATVQRIIRRHGGTICAESKPDAGATFYFTLPESALPPHPPSGSTPGESR